MFAAPEPSTATTGSSEADKHVKALMNRAPARLQEQASAWLVAHPEQAVPVLIDGLEHAPVRRNAAKTLGRIGAPAAVDALAAMLDNGVDGDAHAAAMALARITDERAHAALLDALKRDGAARKVAIDALGARGDPGDCAVLGGLFDDPDDAVNLRAVRAALRVGCLQADTRQALAEHPNPEVRALVASWEQSP